jgi:hypothetical protein
MQSFDGGAMQCCFAIAHTNHHPVANIDASDKNDSKLQSFRQGFWRWNSSEMEVKKKNVLPTMAVGNQKQIGENGTPKDAPANAKPEGSACPGFAGNHFRLWDSAIASD